MFLPRTAAWGGPISEPPDRPDAADRVVDAVRPHLARTSRPEVLESLSGFGAFFALDRRRWKKPLLVSATGGVGDKLELARVLGRHDTIGRDLVAAVIDDIVCSGAEPLLFLDHLAVGALDPGQVEQIVAGIADGCEEAGCALVGGETAARPEVVAPDRYELAGFAVGIVDRERALDADRVEDGDALVAMASTGLHAAGYPLARQVLARAELDLSADHGLRTQTLGDALLRPTRIYAQDCLALIGRAEVRALCHVTTGGVVGSLARVLPEGLGAVVDTATFTPPGVFEVLREHGGLDAAQMWQTFNMGAGMLAIVADGRLATEVLRARGVDAWVCGGVGAGSGVHLRGL